MMTPFRHYRERKKMPDKDREVPIEQSTGEYTAEENRHRKRRKTDMLAEDLEHSLERAEKTIGRFANLIKSGGVIIALAMSAMVWFATQLMGPTRDAIAELRAADAVTRREINELERVTRLNTYLNCVQLRKTDPSLVPNECNDPNLLRVR